MVFCWRILGIGSHLGMGATRSDATSMSSWALVTSEWLRARIITDNPGRSTGGGDPVPLSETGAVLVPGSGSFAIDLQ